MLEALRDQVAEQALELAVVSDCGPPSKPAHECSGQQCLGVDVSKDILHGLLGKSPADSGRFDLPFDSEPPAAAHLRLRPRNGHGHATVIEGALFAKAGHGGVDVVWRVVATRQTLANLRL